MDYLNIDLGPIGQEHLEHGVLSLHYGQVEGGLAWAGAVTWGRASILNYYMRRRKLIRNVRLQLTIVITEVHLPPPRTAF